MKGSEIYLSLNAKASTNINLSPNQIRAAFSKLIIETPEQGVKYVQS